MLCRLRYRLEQLAPRTSGDAPAARTVRLRDRAAARLAEAGWRRVVDLSATRPNGKMTALTSSVALEDEDSSRDF